jgi:hypothetical protein
MLMQAILVLVIFFVSATYCWVLPSSTANQLNDTVRQVRSEVEVHPRIVSILDELKQLGKHPQTVCPFEVEEKIVEKDHPLGNVVIAIDEIVCTASCKNENCSGAGRSCKQLMTTLRVSIRNPVTGLPEKIISTEVAVGCSCVPDDSGSHGEDVD